MADERFELDALFAKARAARAFSPPLPAAMLTSQRFGRLSLGNDWAAAPGDELVDTYLHMEIYDQIDGRIILRPMVHVSAGDQIFAAAAVRRSDGLNIDITQGQASIEEDPFTGDTLLIPKGSIPVKGRPILESQLRGGRVTLSAPELDLGWDIRNISSEQARFEPAGGGPCRARWAVINDEDPHVFELRVRAFMPANVVLLGPGRRDIHWHHALYFARDPKIGLMRLYNNPQYTSKTQMRSAIPDQDITPTNFFPASGQNELFFVLEMLDMGFRCFNKEPMVQSFSNIEWPPYSTALSIEKPVQFFNVDDPDELMLTIEKNDMHIYDYSAIDVECLRWEINSEGLLYSRWRMHNNAEAPVVARWFALGNFVRSAQTIDQGNRLLGPAGTVHDTFEVEFNAQLQKFSLTQFVSMNIVSLDEPVVMGSKIVNYHYPVTG